MKLVHSSKTHMEDVLTFSLVQSIPRNNSSPSRVYHYDVACYYHLFTGPQLYHTSQTQQSYTFTFYYLYFVNKNT
jgi:hypothetical protein